MPASSSACVGAGTPPLKLAGVAAVVARVEVDREARQRRRRPVASCGGRGSSSGGRLPLGRRRGGRALGAGAPRSAAGSTDARDAASSAPVVAAGGRRPCSRPCWPAPRRRRRAGAVRRAPAPAPTPAGGRCRSPAGACGGCAGGRRRGGRHAAGLAVATTCGLVRAAGARPCPAPPVPVRPRRRPGRPRRRRPAAGRRARRLLQRQELVGRDGLAGPHHDEVRVRRELLAPSAG